MENGDYGKLDFLKVNEVLAENPRDKTITLLATDKEQNRAVVFIKKQPFDAAQGQQLFEQCSLRLDLKNDVYHSYDGELSGPLQPTRYTMTYPATDRHIEKARASEIELWEETPEQYATITRLFIDEQLGHLTWVYNILDKNREKCNEIDRIIFEDCDKSAGFIMLPDLKWDQQNNRDLYCQALVHNRKLHSLRDLTAEHLPLLHNLYAKGRSALCEKCGISAKKLRVFLHYHPSHYHLHVHFTATTVDHGALTERAHLLSDVIANIEMKGDYYQKRTLTVPLLKGHKLHTLFGNV